jgi:hypothetical protein
MSRPKREYMQAYRDRREPQRVWHRIVRQFLGPIRYWKVKNRGRGTRMTPLPPRGLPPAKPFPKPITTPPKPDNPPRKPNE